tara:strand:+ start:8417 stop:9760 length:1344 start_codon:yes stop_codon:yes gene_type:complete
MRPGLFSRTSLLALIACGSVGFCVSASSGDEVMMRDGTVYTGKVVSQTRREVVIDTEIAGISTRMTLDRRQIRAVSIGDTPSETPADPAEELTNPPSIPGSINPGASIQTPKSDVKILKRDGVDLIVEIPMNGTFGQDIYPLSIAEGLDWAREQGATDIVFRMNSPGGEVWAAEEIVEIMADHASEFRYHALIEHAISATIWPAFNCDTITMAPGATFGGAVVFRRSGTGSAEVDKKMTSIMAAKLAASAEAKGHSQALVKSMMLSEEGAYAVPDGNGGWTVVSEKPADGETYETIDGPDTVLTLTADQAGKYGIVTVIKNRDINTFAEAQTFGDFDHHDEETNRIAEKTNAQCKRLRSELLGTIQSFYREAEIAEGRGTTAGSGSAIQNMQRQLGIYKIQMRRAENLQMAAIVGSFEQAIDVPFWENELATRLADLRRAVRLRGRP